MSGVPRLRGSRIAVPAVLSGIALALGVPAAMAATSATAAHPRVTTSVNVGTPPLDVAVSPLTGAAYVVDGERYTVTVISGKTHKVAAVILINRGKLTPDLVAVSPVTGDVYVSSLNSRFPAKPSDKGSVTVISGRTNKVIATIPVASEPGQAVISPKTGDVYVSSNGASATSSTMTVINGRTNKVITTIKLGASEGFPQETAISPKTGDIYFANTSTDSVSVISGKTNKVIASVSVAATSTGTPVAPYEVAVSPVTGVVYVVSVGYHTANTVTVISWKTNKVAAVIPNVGGYDVGSGVIAISPKTGTVYVSNFTPGTVSVISGKTNKVTGVIGFPGGYSSSGGIAVNPVNGDVYARDVTYVAGREANAFWVINGTTNKLAGHVIVKDGPSISQKAVSPRTGDAYIAAATDVLVISG
jgi:YVTN family beta-propeller protein